MCETPALLACPADITTFYAPVLSSFMNKASWALLVAAVLAALLTSTWL